MRRFVFDILSVGNNLINFIFLRHEFFIWQLKLNNFLEKKNVICNPIYNYCLPIQTCKQSHPHEKFLRKKLNEQWQYKGGIKENSRKTLNSWKTVEF